MKRKVNYAILRYIPNYERVESINIAVVLHSPEDEYLQMKLITNFNRLKQFDDELDIEFVKSYLKSLKESFTYNLVNSCDMNIKDKDLLKELTCFYVNQFVFELHNDAEIEENCDDFLESLRKGYLHLDIKKEERFSSKETSEFFEKLLKSRNIKYEPIKSKNSLIGNFDDNIKVDFKIADKYYKIINLNDSNVDGYMMTIKMWMLNAIELKEKKEQVIFIVNELIKNEKTEKFIRMLDKYGEVIRLSDIDNYFE